MTARWRGARWRSYWAVPCRDAYGDTARLTIHSGATGLVITASTPGPVRLTPWQARRLRAVLARTER